LPGSSKESIVPSFPSPPSALVIKSAPLFVNTSDISFSPILQRSSKSNPQPNLSHKRRLGEPNANYNSISPDSSNAIEKSSGGESASSALPRATNKKGTTNVTFVQMVKKFQNEVTTTTRQQTGQVESHRMEETHRNVKSSGKKSERAPVKPKNLIQSLPSRVLKSFYFLTEMSNGQLNPPLNTNYYTYIHRADGGRINETMASSSIGSESEEKPKIFAELYIVFAVIFLVLLFLVAIVGFCILTLSISETSRFFVPKRVRVWTLGHNLLNWGSVGWTLHDFFAPRPTDRENLVGTADSGGGNNNNTIVNDSLIDNENNRVVDLLSSSSSFHHPTLCVPNSSRMIDECDYECEYEDEDCEVHSHHHHHHRHEQGPSNEFGNGE